MKRGRNKYGFSLTEVLLAVGTLSIGMIFVAGVFPVAIHFSAEASEQTIAEVVADEAFAKIRLYGIDPLTLHSDQTTLFDSDVTILPFELDEFAYPSYLGANILRSRYCWSALCRRVGDTRLVQVTVFVCRRTRAAPVYWNPASSDADADRPMPFQVVVAGSVGDRELIIVNADRENFINDGYVIVENGTGQLYRALRRDPQRTNTIILDWPWQGGNSVWVIPPPAGGGRYPCIAVYQKIIRF